MKQACRIGETIAVKPSGLTAGFDVVWALQDFTVQRNSLGKTAYLSFLTVSSGCNRRSNFDQVLTDLAVRYVCSRLLSTALHRTAMGSGMAEMDLQGAFNMALSKKKLNAEKARRDYWQSRAETRADLQVPEVSGIVDLADGTLSSSVLGEDLSVKIPQWVVLPEEPTDVDYVTLQWAYVNLDGTPELYVNVVRTSFSGPLTSADFPLEMSVPKRYLADGRYQFRYMHESWAGGSNLSDMLPLICDGTAPYGEIEPPSLILPQDTITDEYLTAHGDQVIGTVPGYSSWQPGDTVSFWWEKSPLPEEPDFPPVATIPVAGPANTDQEVIFPADYIKDKGDGDVVAFYSLRDKAGNRSRYPKTLTTTSVALGPIPIDLQDPVVPFAGDDDLIDLKDAIAGVKVQIPAFTGYHVGGGDQIELTWGATVVALYPVGASPVFPLEIAVPAQTLKAEYGSATDTVSTNVSYRVMRGTQPSAETKNITVDVDFSAIGPARPAPDPDWPNPVNTNLPAAVVRGRVSNTPDQLTEDDKNQPADLEFTLYGPLNEGEYIEFYWDAERVSEATYTVAPGDASGDFKKVEIPWSYIQHAGNKPVPVHYRIGSPDSTNEQQSKTTVVDVTAVIIIPDAPTYPDRDPGNGFLNCGSLDGPDHAIRVQVPDLSVHLKAGDTVTLFWQPYTKRTGGVLIDEAIKTEEIELTAETVKGFIWRVQPYAEHIEPIYIEGGSAGLGRTRYEFKLNGVDVVSETEEAVVGMFTGGGACELS
jgi:hypothetical protein